VQATKTAVLQFLICHLVTRGLEEVRVLQKLSLGAFHTQLHKMQTLTRFSSHGKDTTSKYYYYMWRFGWVFYLIGLFFTVCAFFTALLAPCSRLASGFSGFTLGFALFWFTLAAALMT
jgi:hypothetical protein